MVSGAISLPTLITLAGVANVLDYGAKGDGVTDDTTAFNTALTYNQNVIYPGFRRSGLIAQYLINGNISIPQNGSLTGPNAGPTSCAGNAFYGTDATSTLTSAFLNNPATIPGLLLITGGAGNPSGTEAITIGDNATLQNWACYYPNQPQLLTSASSPVAYPYFARMVVGKNQTIRNGGCVNPYQFLKVDGAWRPTIVDIVGQPYAMGVYVDRCFDVCRINRVHWESFWDAKEVSSGNFNQPWSFANGIGFEFFRCDLIQCVDVFVYGMKQGLVLNSSDTTAGNGPWSTFTNFHADNCPAPITIIRTQSYGANFVNCMLTGGAGTSVTIASTNIGPINFANCTFVSNGTGIASANAGDVTVNGCLFIAVNNTNYPAINHTGGGMLASCNNFQNNTTHYVNTGSATWAILGLNRCKGAVSITNTGGITAFAQANNLPT